MILSSIKQSTCCKLSNAVNFAINLEDHKNCTPACGNFTSDGTVVRGAERKNLRSVPSQSQGCIIIVSKVGP